MKRNLLTLAGALAGLTLAAGSAQAVEIENMDGEERVIEIRVGGATRNVTIAAGQTLDEDCGPGCEIVLGEEFMDQLSGEERIIIENGMLGYDG